MTARHGLGIVGPSSVGVTVPQDMRLVMASLLSAGFGAGPLDASAGIIYGPGNPCNVTGSSSGPNMQYVVAAGPLATSRGSASDGLIPWVNDAPVTVNTATPAPGSGSRYDLIWARARNANDGFGDANSDPEFNFTVGTAGSTPAKPYGSVPAGALVLAESLVGTSIANASLATITMVAPYKVARGAPVPVRSLAERNALFAYDGLEVFRLDTEVKERYDGGSWGQTRAWQATPRSGTSDNFSAGARTSLQTLTFTGPPGTYQVVSRLSISSSLGAADAGLLWVNAGGTDIVASAHADVNSAQRETFTTIASFFTSAGGSLTVHHDYQMINHIGTVWNGASTDLSVFWLGA